ncbi:S1/P1 nuclease [Blastocladiella britannica]|nr:S1/P1 nuclease [Blastocladiella britannica]
MLKVKAEALAFAAHFIGDISQPLHASNFALGGNHIYAKFLGYAGSKSDAEFHTNMHFIWDISVPQKQIATEFGGSWDKWVDALEANGAAAGPVTGVQCAQTVDPTDFLAVRKCVDSWAIESDILTCDVVFKNGGEAALPFLDKKNDPNQIDLSGDYYAAVKSVVDQQIYRGGIRLAAFLNNIFQ